MTEDEARERVESLAREMCESIKAARGFTPDAYWIDRTRYRIQDLKGSPIATLHVETVQ